MTVPERSFRWADLNPVRAHERAGQRPVVVLSHDVFATPTARCYLGMPPTLRQAVASCSGRIQSRWMFPMGSAPRSSAWCRSGLPALLALLVPGLAFAQGQTSPPPAARANRIDVETA